MPGGGAALLHASRSLSDVLESMSNLDQRVGVDIVMRAVQMPAKTLCKNAGHEGAVIVGKLLESDDQNWGFDAAKGEFCNMVDSGAPRPHHPPCDSAAASASKLARAFSNCVSPT